MEPVFYALGANISFALGSIFFVFYARKFSSLWLNTFKAAIATICFFIAVMCTSGFHPISLSNFSIFLLSGFFALGLGDLFLVKGFAILGAGRTMILFGFQPLIIGFLSFVLFDQVVAGDRLYAIIFFILCLITFSYENFKKTGSWEVKGLVFAFLGMAIDAVGVIVTRHAFDMNANISAFEGNLYRCLGALGAYVIINRFRKINFFSNLRQLTMTSRAYVSLGAFLGTFLSLAFYLQAIKTGHLATVSAISITSVLFASIFEGIWERKLPTPYLWYSLIFFGVGMYILIF